MQYPDVLTIGNASYDLIFSVPRHPNADEKMDADAFAACGGGPAANAAVTVARLGAGAAFCGYLGTDSYGEKHFQELVRHRVDTGFVVRGQTPTPLSAIFVQPNGKRSLVNYRKNKKYLPAGAVNFSLVRPKVVLFDGHEPLLSQKMLARAQQKGIPTILDAGSVHEGTRNLAGRVDYLICSEKFALNYAKSPEINTALDFLSQTARHIVITLGERGLVWKKDGAAGRLPALKVAAVDTTGAGDVFHGAFAYCLVKNMRWEDALAFSSAAAAASCTKTGGRPGIPLLKEVENLWRRKF